MFFWRSGTCSAYTSFKAAFEKYIICRHLHCFDVQESWIPYVMEDSSMLAHVLKFRDDEFSSFRTLIIFITTVVAQIYSTSWGRLLNRPDFSSYAATQYSPPPIRTFSKNTLSIRQLSQGKRLVPACGLFVSPMINLCVSPVSETGTELLCFLFIGLSDLRCIGWVLERRRRGVRTSVSVPALKNWLWDSAETCKIGSWDSN